MLNRRLLGLENSIFVIYFTVCSLFRIRIDRSLKMGFKFPVLPTMKVSLIHARPVHRGGNSRVKTEFGALNIYSVLQSTSGHFLNMYHYTNASLTIVRVMKSRRMRWAGNVERMGERRNLYCVLVGKPEGKGPLGRPRRRWEDNIEMDL